MDKISKIESFLDRYNAGRKEDQKITGVEQNKPIEKEVPTPEGNITVQELEEHVKELEKGLDLTRTNYQPDKTFLEWEAEQAEKKPQKPLYSSELHYWQIRLTEYLNLRTGREKKTKAREERLQKLIATSEGAENGRYQFMLNRLRKVEAQHEAVLVNNIETCKARIEKLTA